jgi:hypothetical protein
MAVTVRANLKDENYFAQAASRTTRARAPQGLLAGESGNGATGEAYFIKKGSRLPLEYVTGRMRERLLFLAGKSPLAQLPERHFSAHRLAIGLA